MEYNLSDPSATGISEGKPKVIVGVHPYDMFAIKQMDKYFLDTNVDDPYLAKRKNTLVIGCNVQNPSDKAFFGAMKTGGVANGFDLFLTDMDDKIAILVGTKEGHRLLQLAGDLTVADSETVQNVKNILALGIKKTKRDLRAGPEKWQGLLAENYNSEIWKDQTAKCLSCGSCTLVCPTCFCYDVVDEANLDLTTGSRKRTWDGCLLRDFTKVGTDEIFRDKLEDRYRHRFHRKGSYLPSMLGFVACVGCGRCASACVPDIADPVDLFNKLEGQTSTHIPSTENTPLTDEMGVDEMLVKDALYIPRSATLKKVEKLTELETLFEITLDDGKPLGHVPGQFVEVSILGIGEAPISVSSSPGTNTFQLVVRKVGDVTTKLHAMSAGDKVGIRGPFGTGFDTEGLKGENILFIGGGLGIVPMRSMINYVLEHRADYNEVTILYGCKEPGEMLFRDEVAKWESMDNLQFLKTVDRVPEGVAWDSNEGVITTLIPKAKFDPKNTKAIVVGPPIMYRFVNKSLFDLGVPGENIIVSLERRMKCGVGKCGHCQINGIYVCKEGPVFNYKDLEELPEAF